MKHSLFYPVVYGFIVGIFIRSIGDIDNDVVIILFLISLSLVGYLIQTGLRYSQPETKTYSLFFITLIFILANTVGIFRYDLFVKHPTNDPLLNRIGEETEVEGVVVDEPGETAKGLRFIVRLSQNKNVKIILTDTLYSEVVYGDQVKVHGTVVLPEDFETDNGGVFHYVKYLAKDNIFYQLKNPQVEIRAHHQASRIKELLFKIKNAFVGKLNKSISYPESTLAAGLTIAGKKALPPTIEDEFQRTGTLQVVVLSGYNITIVAEAFMAMTASLPMLISSGIGVVGIILFTIMAGGSATVVRGSVMVVIVIAAKLLRRRYNVIRSLMLAACLMLVINPMLLVYDPSFQLSFLATLGLILVSPIVEKHLGFVTERVGLRQVAAATLATQIFVTPFILYTSGQLSIVAVPTNLLLFLFIPITMLACFITGMLGFVSVILAAPFSYLAFIFLSYELSIIHIFAEIPLASVTISSFPVWLMIVVYMSYGVFIRRFYKNK